MARTASSDCQKVAIKKMRELLRSYFNVVGVGLRHELQTAVQQHLCRS
jgi:hypothetical protein